MYLIVCPFALSPYYIHLQEFILMFVGIRLFSTMSVTWGWMGRGRRGGAGVMFASILSCDIMVKVFFHSNKKRDVKLTLKNELNVPYFLFPWITGYASYLVHHQ